ncbi:MAG TPA: putative glycoside hydrolase [Longimicrobiaceae bacterium]|nr:putative glycoside hydrolase [Longimicrobiaceae bacterium]
MSRVQPPIAPSRRRARAPLACALVLLGLAACGGDSGQAPGARSVGGARGADSAASVERTRADSLARWRERFGDRVPRPDSVRALYVNGWAAGRREGMRDLIRIADETEINAFIIDIKESDTYLVHDSTGIALVREIGADQRPGSRWLPELVDTLQAHGIYPIARIVVFKDRMLAEKRPDLAIRHVNGGLWRDKTGKPWVNPYHRTVWDYNVDIAREALDMGFSEIQWDYVRFPDVLESQRRTMVFPGSNGVSREDNIASFIRYSKERLKEYQVPVTADVFGLVTHLEGDAGIGQNWEKVIQAADVVLPMVYPSHYYRGFYGFTYPNAHPYEVIRISMQDGVERSGYLRREGVKPAEIMPWLEAQTASWIQPTVEYGPAQLRQQIQAVYDSGLKSWALWNPRSEFTRYLPAFRPANGGLSQVERSGWRPTRWEVPRSRLSPVIRRRAAAERAARDSAARVQAGGDSARVRR